MAPKRRLFSDKEEPRQRHHRRSALQFERKQDQALDLEEEADSRSKVKENQCDSNGIRDDNLIDNLDLNMADFLKDFQCPICLEIIKKTRTSKKCLHRFCRECIEKSLRFKKDCPTCRTHFTSRRALRDDPAFDKLIKIFFTDSKEINEEEGGISEVRSTPAAQTTPNIEGLTCGSGGTKTSDGRSGRSRDTHDHFPKLADHVSESNFDVIVICVPLNNEQTPSLQQLQFCCSSSFAAEYLFQYVAQKNSLKPEEIELYLAKEVFDLNKKPSSLIKTLTSTPTCNESLNLLSEAIDRSEIFFEHLESNQTLGNILKGDVDPTNQNQLILIYKHKRD